MATQKQIEDKLDSLIGLYHKLDKKAGVMNEHIESQNGKVGRNEDDIVENKKAISGMKLWIATWSGGAATVGVLLQQIF